MGKTLCIICNRNTGLHRADVEAIDEREIHGVKCFMHKEGDEFVVSSLECGAQISHSEWPITAWLIASDRLKDQEIWIAKLNACRDYILESGHIYPINAIEA